MTDIGVALFDMLMLDDDNRRSVVAEAPDPVRFTLHRLADTGLGGETPKMIISSGGYRITLVVIAFSSSE